MNSDIKLTWEKNAEEWIKAIQNETIESRQFTNKAVLDTVQEISPSKIVDMGCGEGWLTRALSDTDIEVTGIDVTDKLIIEAKKKDASNFFELSFEEIINGKPIPNSPYDAAIFNFCIYFKSELKKLLTKTLDSIVNNGCIVIQTVHPFFLIQGNLPYKSQWLDDSWKGLPGKFEDGHCWYARTIEDWFKILSSLEDTIFSIKEIVNDHDKPVSVIFKITKTS